MLYSYIKNSKIKANDLGIEKSYANLLEKLLLKETNPDSESKAKFDKEISSPHLHKNPTSYKI